MRIWPISFCAAMPREPSGAGGNLYHGGFLAARGVPLGNSGWAQRPARIPKHVETRDSRGSAAIRVGEREARRARSVRNARERRRWLVAPLPHAVIRHARERLPRESTRSRCSLHDGMGTLRATFAAIHV